MTNKQYLYAMDLIKNNQSVINKNLLLPFFPQSKANIIRLEKVLKLNLPISYKGFLCQYGMLVFGGIDIYGLRDNKDDYTIISYTLEERNTNKDPVFPKSFVVIYDLGNGEKYCLDTAKMNNEGECPVMAWYFGRIEQVYEDFGAFFLDTLKTGLKSLENRGEKINW